LATRLNGIHHVLVAKDYRAFVPRRDTTDPIPE
jgi:hypothetical protein